MGTEECERPESFELAVEEAKPFLLEKDEEEAQYPEATAADAQSTGPPSKKVFLGMSMKLCIAIAVNCFSTAGIVRTTTSAITVPNPLLATY